MQINPSHSRQVRRIYSAKTVTWGNGEMERPDRPSREHLEKAIRWLLSLDPDDPKNFRTRPEPHTAAPGPVRSE